MKNEFSTQLLASLKKDQASDVEQVSRYKALMLQLDLIVQERAQTIKLLEQSVNVEAMNMTLREVLTGRRV